MQCAMHTVHGGAFVNTVTTPDLVPSLLAGEITGNLIWVRIVSKSSQKYEIVFSPCQDYYLFVRLDFAFGQSLSLIFGYLYVCTV